MSGSKSNSSTTLHPAKQIDLYIQVSKSIDSVDYQNFPSTLKIFFSLLLLKIWACTSDNKANRYFTHLILVQEPMKVKELTQNFN